jgi:uncharacterized protein (TIGR02271 family)
MARKTKQTTVVGVFEDSARAQAAVAELSRLGFREDQIGVLSRDSRKGGKSRVKGKKGSHIAEGAAAGVAAGAGVGALWALGIAAGMLPAIGPVIAGGLLASVLASAAGGAAAAGIIGALIGLGIPEEDARYYEEEFKAGRTIVTVKANGRYDEAVAVIRRHGGYDRTTAAEACATDVAAAGGKTIKVHEEQLRARKRPVETGNVRVRKNVVTEHQTLDVPVQREEVVVERRPASGTASSADIRAGQELRIPVSKERVTVKKQPVVKEEVRVGKRTVTETARVGGKVRKEKVAVEKEGDVDVRSCPPGGNKGKTGR